MNPHKQTARLATTVCRVWIVVPILLLTHGILQAQTFNWSGFGFFNDDFSNPDNWFEQAVPQAGDVCQFTNGTSSGVVDYDVPAAPRYGILRFIGPWQVTGQRIGARILEVVKVKEEGLSSGFGNVTLFGGAYTRSFPSRIELSGGGLFRIHGLVADADTTIVAHKDVFFAVGEDFPRAGSANLIEIRDGISGAGAIFIESENAPSSEQPDSHVSFPGANTFTGKVTVGNEARLRIFDVASLGSPVSGTEVMGGFFFPTKGSLEIEMGVARTLAEPLTVRGGIVQTFVDGTGTGGELTLTGPLECSSADFFLATPLRLATTLSGDFGTVRFGGGLSDDPARRRVSLSGTSPNTFSGTIESSSDLLLDKPSGVIAVPNKLIVHRPATVTWARSNQIADTSLIELGDANLNDKSETVAGLALKGGTLRTGFSGSLRVNALITGGGTIEGKLLLGQANLRIEPVNDLDITATISPAVAGAGIALTTLRADSTLRISGVNTVPAVVNSGNLEVNSNSPLMPVALNQGGTEGGIFFVAPEIGVLSGTGRVGAVTAGSGGGMVSPGGNSPGILRSGSLSLNGESVFRADLHGTTAGSGFDQLIVTGKVALNGAALNIVPELVPNGSSFTIIENDGTDPISGTFAGYPQGARVGGFAISYTGGTGNDVTLIRVSLGRGITRTWTGLGTDSNWTTSANWSPSGTPADGDMLVFPDGAARRTNVNNFRIGLGGIAFRALVFTGGPYRISGNPVALDEGITVSGSTKMTHFVDLPISLLGLQAFSVGDQVLSLGGAIDTNGMPLTFNTQGKATTSVIACNGVISEGAAEQFIKTGSGILILANANTTRGNFHIRQGTVEIRNSAALGSRLGSTRVDKTAQLTVAGTNLGVNETILLEGTLRIANNAGEPSFSDPIECAPSAKIFVSATGVTGCNIFDEIRGSVLTKTGPGTLTLTGAKTKSLSEGITIDEGRVVVTGTAGTILLPGNTTVGVSPTRAAELEIRQRRVTEADSHLIVNESGSVSLNSAEIAFAGLTLKGGFVSTDGNGFALNGPLVSLASFKSAFVSGRITMPAGISDWNIADGSASIDLQMNALLREEVLTDAVLRKSGSGSCIFTGANTLSGVTFQSGANIWSGISNSTAITVSGGTLAGTGRSLSLSARDTGVVAPGNSPGLFTTGSLDLLNGGTLHFELNGTNPGENHDQIRCTDNPANVDLGGARLSLASGFTPAPGTILTLIDIQGSGVAAPFTNLPEGSTVLAGSVRYRISYLGGTGNDVTITSLPQVGFSEIGITEITVTNGLPGGLRVISGTISSGPIAGAGIDVEVSKDLLLWSPLPLRFADENGNAYFNHTVLVNDTPNLFFRWRVR